VDPRVHLCRAHSRKSYIDGNQRSEKERERCSPFISTVLQPTSYHHLVLGLYLVRLRCPRDHLVLHAQASGQGRRLEAGLLWQPLVHVLLLLLCHFGKPSVSGSRAIYNGKSIWLTGTFIVLSVAFTPLGIYSAVQGIIDGVSSIRYITCCGFRLTDMASLSCSTVLQGYLQAPVLLLDGANPHLEDVRRKDRKQKRNHTM
jgi:hypothetical protein